MKSIAAYARSAWVLGAFSVFLLSGCTGFSPSVGISFPIGGLGSIGVNVGADGRVGGTVGVGVGGASVNVGTSGQLPLGHKTEAPVAKTDTPAAKADTVSAKTDPSTDKPAQ
jgi:hypothetical protein